MNEYITNTNKFISKSMEDAPRNGRSKFANTTEITEG